ncbi:diguanylate cyclase [Marinobacter sp.]|uniref:diguanylate cyclase n=1 Tax=Marinobacter sp. TaxID=50741 RepID=UPI003A90B496
MTSDQSWKEKYFNELKSAEYREKHWKTERNALERMLVRTSLASEGQAPELDRLLALVRSDLRKNNVDVTTWKELQIQIDREVALLDDAPSRAVRNRNEQLTEVVAEPVSENPSESLLPVTAVDHGQRLLIARRVGQLIGQLLTQVSLEAEAEAHARNLQRSLLTSDSWEELREGLNQVADLVIASVTRGQREFESFLKRLDERLEALKQHFSVQSSAQVGRQAAAEALDREIRAEIELVGQHVEASDDLQELKHSVGRHLESIGNVVGRFQAQESEREKALSEELTAMREKVALLETHSEEMQGQVRKERERAMTDLLTQLPNREAWQERVAFELNRWQRYQYPLTLSVLDIDFFKRVNDTYGHKAGDKVLQLLAREIKKRVRKSDFAARFGGEEFVLLFPETLPDSAHTVLDELRAHVSALPFHFGGEPLTITFSAGLASFASGDTEESVFNRADKALYLAKNSGRNCIKIG